MTEKKKKKDCKLDERMKNLEAINAVQAHKINILTSRVTLLEIGMKALGAQIKKEEP